MAVKRYDIFLSYPRRDAIVSWVAQVLQPTLQRQLDANGPEASIFRDSDDIEAGDLWKDSLANALARSRVMVAVLCAPYFESRWCTSEWATACARDDLLRASDPEHPSMIIPVRYNDMDDLDLRLLKAKVRKQVADRQRFDLFEYSQLVNPFADNNLALRFRISIDDLCRNTLRRVLDTAPAYDPRWPRLPSDPLLAGRRRFRVSMGKKK